MNVSHRELAPNSTAIKRKNEPRKVAPATPAETPPSTNVQAWTKSVLTVTNRASTDEKYRKELAKRIR